MTISSVSESLRALAAQEAPPATPPTIKIRLLSIIKLLKDGYVQHIVSP
jgi:hypothetical protein